jgi:hypothetical protein
MVRRLVTNITAIVLSVLPVRAQGPSLEQSLGYYQDVTQTVIRNARVLVSPALSAEQRVVERTIRISVPATGDVTALARRDSNKQPQIIISAGFIEVMEWTATAIGFERAGLKGCVEAYLPHLINGILENTRSVNAGGVPYKVYGPLLFGTLSRNACTGASLKVFSGEVGRTFASQMNASILFLYLHELAHHLLGHVDSGETRRDRIRAQEAAADAWAIKTAYAVDFDLTVASPAFILISGLGGNSLEDERNSDHPLGVRRVYDMLSEARAVLVRSDPQAASEVDKILVALGRIVPIPKQR